MPEICVLLVEDLMLVRKGILSLLEAEPDITVIGEASSGREAVEMAKGLCPDILLMALNLPELNGIEATRQVRRYCPHVKVIALTQHTEEKYVLETLRAGASGYVVKQAAPDELIMAIRAVQQGHRFLSPLVAQGIIQHATQNDHNTPPEASYDTLTEREREIFQLLAEGYSNREIADMLVISIKTVQTHRTHIMDKLNLSTIPDLVKLAIIRGVITVDPLDN